MEYMNLANDQERRADLSEAYDKDDDYVDLDEDVNSTSVQENNMKDTRMVLSKKDKVYGQNVFLKDNQEIFRKTVGKTFDLKNRPNIE